MQSNGNDEIYQLTADQFQLIQGRIKADVRVLKVHEAKSAQVRLHVAEAEDNLEWASRLRAGSSYHDAEIRLIHALLNVNDALAAM